MYTILEIGPRSRFKLSNRISCTLTTLDSVVVEYVREKLASSFRPITCQILSFRPITCQILSFFSMNFFVVHVFLHYAMLRNADIATIGAFHLMTEVDTSVVLSLLFIE